MANLNFRDLRADEVDCRVSQISEKGLSLLLYKDARCDMIILDETVGAMNWQRSHSRDNANCTVSIWDDVKGQWISKEDVGTESNTEAVKGLASDSFKRACFNWGVGRELYTAPFIWIPAGNYSVYTNKSGKPATNDKFILKELIIKDKKIIGLSIYNASAKKNVYTWGKSKYTSKDEMAAPPPASAPVPVAAPAPVPQRSARDELRAFCDANGLDKNMIVQMCGLHRKSTENDYMAALMFAQTMVGG